MSSKRHFTTRRDFIGTMGFGALGLYATWAAYGASPVPFGSSDAPVDPHAGHGANALHGGREEPAITEADAPRRMTATEFQTRHAEFVATNTRPDGSVKPMPPSSDHVHGGNGRSEHDRAQGHDQGHHHDTTAPVSTPTAVPQPTEQRNGRPPDRTTQTSHDEHAGHDMHAEPMAHDMASMPQMSTLPDLHAGHAVPMPAPQQPAAPTHDMHAAHAAPPVASPTAPSRETPEAVAEHDHSRADGPIEVFLAAGRFSFEPADLRLEKGRAYRFHMMATDVAHGASIAFGRASRIVRLRPDTVTTLDLTFAEAGRHLIYCTVYCGPGHDGMRASITVG